MIKTALTEKQIDKGKSLISKLDQSGLQVEAGFWLYESEKDAWKLVIASSSPDIKQAIPKSVELLALNDPLIKNIASAIHTGPGIVGASFSNNQFNDLFIEGLYLYRVNLNSVE